MEMKPMKLGDDELASFTGSGYLFLERVFSDAEIEMLRGQLPVVSAEDSPWRVLEKTGGAVRSVYGCHTTNRYFGLLTQHPRMLVPAI
jgi:hypothetical protein